MQFPVTEIHTPRLVLRLPRLSDATSVFEHYAKDPAVSRYLQWQPHETLQTTLEYLAACVDGWDNPNSSEHSWVIEHRGTGMLLGMIGARRDRHRVNLGYVLSRQFWGQGLMTEAVLGVIRAAFNDGTIRRVDALCDVDNVASARVMEKAGMTLEGILRGWANHPNMGPEPRDCKSYSILARD